MSQNAQHTPGPYVVYNQMQTGRGGLEVEITCPKGQRIIKGEANVQGRTYPELVATFALLAAAPDLLEALEGVIKFRNWQLAEGGITPADLLDVWKNAEAAIAKATLS